MSITVKHFNEHKAKEELKKCPKIVQEYFKLIMGHYEKQKELTTKAISKLKELSKDENNRS